MWRPIFGSDCGLNRNASIVVNTTLTVMYLFSMILPVVACRLLNMDSPALWLPRVLLRIWQAAHASFLAKAGARQEVCQRFLAGKGVSLAFGWFSRGLLGFSRQLAKPTLRSQHIEMGAICILPPTLPGAMSKTIAWLADDSHGPWVLRALGLTDMWRDYNCTWFP